MSAPSGATATKVRVGIIGSSSDTGVFLADERGYFKDEGIELEIVPFQTGPDMVAPAGTGQLDVATGAPSASLFNAIARGIPLRIVADKGSQRPGWVFSSIAIRQDLIDGGQVKGWADLKGRKIALAGLGGSGQVFLDKAMQRGGATWKDLDVTLLGYADMGAALAGKSIDGGVTIEPFRTQWPQKGLGTYLPDDSEIYLDQQAAVVMYGPKFIQDNGPAAKRFMVAYLRGVRDYNDAFIKNRGRDAVIDIMIKRTSLKERALYGKIGLAGLDPNGAVLSQDLVAQQEFYLKYEYQTARIEMATAIDSQFADYAVGNLGKYTA